MPRPPPPTITRPPPPTNEPVRDFAPGLARGLVVLVRPVVFVRSNSTGIDGDGTAGEYLRQPDQVETRR